MKRKGGEDGSLSWGHPGRRFPSVAEPPGDRGAGRRRPLLIALAFGAVAASGLYLAWEARAESREAVAEAEAEVSADTASAASGAPAEGPDPAASELRAEIEKLLLGERRDRPGRVLKRSELPAPDQLIPGI